MPFRTVPAVAALGHNRRVPQKAALARTRSVVVKAALAHARTLPLHAALSGAINRTVPLHAAFSATPHRSVPVLASLGSASGATMLAMLPSVIYANSAVMEAILQAQGNQLDNLTRALNESLNAFYVMLAPSWALNIWEAELGLQTVASMTIGQRQQRLLGLLAGGAIPTIGVVQAVADALAYGTALVYEDIPGYTVYFVFPVQSPLSVANFQAVKQALRAVLPAHLDFLVNFGGLTWDQLDALHWSWDTLDGLGLDWNQLDLY